MSEKKKDLAAKPKENTFVQLGYLQPSEDYPFPVISIIHLRAKEIAGQLGPDI